MEKIIGKYHVWKSWSDHDFGYTTVEDKHYYKAQLKSSNICPLNTDRVVEFGFGNGSFMNYIKSECLIDVFGFEIDEIMITKGRNSGFKCFHEKNALQILEKNTVDYVFAFDVIEHMAKEQIVEWLQSVNGYLKKNGKLFLRFPNGDSPLSMPLQNGDCTHALLIGSSMIEQFAEMTQFKVTYIDGSSRPICCGSFKKSIYRIFTNPIRTICDFIYKALFFPDGNPRLSSTSLVCVLTK